MTAALTPLTTPAPLTLATEVVYSDAPTHPVAVYLSTLAQGSRRTMLEALTTIARLLEAHEDVTAYDIPWQQVHYHHAAALRARLQERYAHTTANKMLSALRGVLKACWRLGLMSGEDYHTARSIEAISGETLPAGREVPSGERFALMEACANDRSPLGRRDAAMLALLYGCGLRREEVSSLNLEDYDTGARSFRLVGKRNKQRMAYLSASGAADALDDWLAVRCVDGACVGAVFVNCYKGGRPREGTRLSPGGIWEMLQKRAEQARVPKLSPHDFRRTFVGDLLEVGVDLVTVQKLAGHANVTTTARYDRRPEEAKRKAAALLHVPYRRMG